MNAVTYKWNCKIVHCLLPACKCDMNKDIPLLTKEKIMYMDNCCNYMEQSPFWEANSPSASQETPPPSFMGPKDSLPCSQGPIGPSPEPDVSSLQFPTLFP